MTVSEIVAQVLLWVGVAATLLCCLGVWWLREVFDRLHFAAAATNVGPVLIGIAAVITGVGSASGTAEVVTAAAVLLVANPLVTHAMARAARQYRYHDLVPEPPEHAEEPK